MIFFKVLIAGSRSIENFDLSPFVPAETDLIISGGAKGVDLLAEKYADEHRISKLIIRPKYELYGKSAPLKRNKVMVELADVVIVIWDGSSQGACSTIKYAKKLNKALTIITYKDE